MCPSRASASGKPVFEVNRISRRPYPPRFSTRASNSPSPKIMRSPTGIFLPGRTRVSQRSDSTWRTSKTSMEALRCWSRAALSCPGFSERIPSRRPKSRAGSTRALLRTISSSPRSISGKSRNWQSCIVSDSRSITSILDASRSSKGCCAINSGGKSKSNSLSSIGVVILRSRSKYAVPS